MRNKDLNCFVNILEYGIKYRYPKILPKRYGKTLYFT